MLRVAHPVPATWRGGTIPMVSARVSLHERAVAWYQRVSNGAGVLERIRAIGAAVLVRFHKARSLTQTPSAFERLGEDVIAMQIAGVSPHQLRSVAVELHQLVEDLDAAPTDERTVMAALRTAQEAEANENLAEARLLCAPDPMHHDAHLDAVSVAKRAKVAADHHALTQVAKLRRQLRASRLGITPLRGGRA